VELLSFTGKLNDQKITVLDWVTASEENNKQFDVEISADGSSFTLLGSVLSQGNSGSEQYYQYVHIAPQPGTSWYRLKQIDWDGQWKYSNIIQVNVSNDMVRPFVYPVPAKNSITINFGMQAKRADISILSTDMKTMKQETINGPALKREINIQTLPQGVYFIRLTTDGHTRILRFIKE
jgi:hypothetical protein